MAQQIGRAVKAVGGSAFLNEELEIGDDFSEMIRVALRSSDELIAYLTPWALDRPWVWMEIGAAWALNLRIVCVLQGLTPDDLRADNRVPITLATKNFVQLAAIEADYLPQLKRRCQRKSS